MKKGDHLGLSKDKFIGNYLAEMYIQCTYPEGLGFYALEFYIDLCNVISCRWLIIDTICVNLC